MILHDVFLFLKSHVHHPRVITRLSSSLKINSYAKEMRPPVDLVLTVKRKQICLHRCYSRDKPTATAANNLSFYTPSSGPLHQVETLFASQNPRFGLGRFERKFTCNYTSTVYLK